MTDVLRRPASRAVADQAVIAEPDGGRVAGAPVTVRRDRRVLRGLGFAVRRPFLVIAVGWIGLVAVAAFAPTALTSRPPLKTQTKAKLLAPSLHHLFGTDQLGRDLFSRMVHGSKLSMQGALLAVAVGLLVGVTLGLVAGFARGWVDDVIMRLVDVVLAIPSLLLSLALITVLGFGTHNIAIAVGVALIASTARVMRSEVLRVRESVYVEAAHSNGTRWIGVLTRHVLPNSISPVIVLAALQFGQAILTVSALSFLGYGVQPPTPEWGSLVSTGRDFLGTAWWLTTMPGLTIALTVLAANRISRAFDGEGRYGR